MPTRTLTRSRTRTGGGDVLNQPNPRDKRALNLRSPDNQATPPKMKPKA